MHRKHLIFIILLLVSTSFCAVKIELQPKFNKDTCNINIIANKTETIYEYEIKESLEVRQKMKKLELTGSIYKITSYFCEKFPFIEHFDAFNCHVKILDRNAFQKCGNLKVLELSGNSISTLIYNDIFKSNKGLVQIRMQENGITKVNPRLFDGLNDLEVLNLSSNDLNELKLEEFDKLSGLKTLKLHGNPWWYLDGHAIIMKFPALKRVTVVSESVQRSGKPSRFYCENLKMLSGILASNGIDSDIKNNTDCIKNFETWYQECLNDPICKDISKEIIRKKLRQETLEEPETPNLMRSVPDTTKKSGFDMNLILFLITVLFISIMIVYIGVKVFKCMNKEKPVLSENDTNNKRLVQSSCDTTGTPSKVVVVPDNVSPEIPDHDKFLCKFSLDKDTIVERGLKISYGTFGVVYQGTLTRKGSEMTQVAIKYINPFANQPSQKILTEITTMQQLDHPNIVRFFGYTSHNTIEAETHIIVMEYVEGGSIRNHLEKLTDTFARSASDYLNLLEFVRHIALGLQYLFEQNIVHRDLAARNILISGNKIAKICDFGFARFCNKHEVYMERTKDVARPYKWYSPEAISSGEYTKMSDIWSFGVTMYEIFSLGDRPYENIRELEVLIEKINTEYLKKPEFCPDQIYEQLMLPCWNRDVERRATIEQVLEVIKSFIEHYSLQQGCYLTR